MPSAREIIERLRVIWSTAIQANLGGDQWVYVYDESLRAIRKLRVAELANMGLEIAKGNVDGHAGDTKFGRSSNVDDGTATDLWDRANATDNDPIWTAPTQARVHDIDSTSANDTLAGTGARVVQIYGLTDWDSKEVTEVVAMNGTTNVVTDNAYVIIHRMKVLEKGSTDTNVGTIRATAQTDSTVTAQINAGEGQTQMVVMGWSSSQILYLNGFDNTVQAVASGKEILTRILVNPEPHQELANFVTKFIFGVGGSGTTCYERKLSIPLKYPGPGIIKIQSQGVGGSDIDVSGSLDYTLVDNPALATIQTMQMTASTAYAAGRVTSGAPTAVSAMCWMKSTNEAAIRYILAEYLTTGNHRMWALWHNATTGFLGLYTSADGSAISTTQSAVDVSDSTFHHVGFKWESGTNQTVLYVDGVAVFKATGAASMFNGTNQFQCSGFNAPSSSNALFGQMRDVKVWQRALTPGEFWAGYNGNTIDSTSLVLDCPADEGTGTVIEDKSGSDNDLTFNGTWTAEEDFR